jgi:rhamnose utilization protein RhaD (predicted bifunctional aldolase and dehydrogenase)/NAD(P)-dependent dehydrogenase (short-subunit alcohol dehydrogenase family)
VKSRWNDDEAAVIADDPGLLAYASRLLGADPTLVLAGGGNSSVKTTEADVFGDPVEVLHVKGSGWDMAELEPGGLAPLRLATVARLAELPELTDARMAAELKAASLDPAAPAPSVESILHAILPFRFVLHTHADAVLALTNTADGEARVREAYGDDVVVVPYVMPGFVLAKACAETFPAARHDGTLGMVLLNHGLFTFADDARTAYENHVALVDRALARLDVARHGDLAAGEDSGSDEDPLDIGAFGAGDASAFGSGSGAAIAGVVDATDGDAGRDDPGTLGSIAALRRDVSRVAGAPMVLRTADGEATGRLVRRSDLATVTQVGPATPDHVLRTKRVPLVGRDVAGYARDYQAYVSRNRARLGDRTLIPVDPAPRVVLDPDLGALVAGRRVADAVAAAEIVDHTAWVIDQAELLGGYVTPSEADIFDVEYWELEQAKLARQPAPAALSGRIALVTGAASGIGKATALALLSAGAAVVGVDLDDPSGVAEGAAFVGVQGDATDPTVLDHALSRAVRGFGGLDALVVNAGVFPPPRPLAELSDDEWARTLGINAGGGLAIMRAAHPYLRVSPVGGSVVVVASKNVPAPGGGAGAYSSSKAALTQLARVAALEWGRDGIRVNVLHPDAVFDTALWTDDLIAERAAGYGLTPEQYRRRNVLGAEVTSAHVAAAAVALCGPTFARTTGAQIAVDGGNDRVI